MPNSEIPVLSLITAAKMNEITTGTTAPASPVQGQLWVDTSQARSYLQVRGAGQWDSMLKMDWGINTGAQTLTSTSLTDITNGGTWELHPLPGGASYYLEVEFACSAGQISGGSQFKDILLNLTRSNGAGSMTLYSGMGQAFLETQAAVPVQTLGDITPAMSGGTTLDLTASTLIGTHGFTAWFKSWCLFTVSGVGTWKFQGAKSGAETLDPIINRFKATLRYPVEGM